MLHRLVLFIELGTVQTGTGKVDPTRKFKCNTESIDEDSKDIIKELIQHGSIKVEAPVLHSHAFRNGTSTSYSEKYRSAIPPHMDKAVHEKYHIDFMMFDCTIEPYWTYSKHNLH